MSDYVLVPSLERASIDDYVRLFNASYGGDDKLNARYLAWQYLENPHGKVIGTDAYLGDELAAHYAIIPRRYQLGAQAFSAALSVNTATHPSHQGKGLFTRLASATYAAAAERGVQFVVGVANAQSVGGFTRKLGFEEVGQVRLHLSTQGLIPAPGSLGVETSPEWLAWRLANPSRAYERLLHGDGTATVRTWVKHVPFNIGRLDAPSAAAAMSVQALRRGSRLVPGLTPYFGAQPCGWPRLPLRAQPSPWHVIWRSLDDQLEAGLSKRLRFDGLAMDTF